MGFIEDRIAERERLTKDRRLILDSVDSLWHGLWEAIVQEINEYRAKYGQNSVLTNGTWGEHIITTPAEVIHGAPVGVKDTVTISRAQNSPFITAGKLKFECKICKDRIVCLTLDENEISFKEASIRILDPLLFPDLPRLS